MPNPTIDPDIERVIEAQHHDPFAVLGPHPAPEGVAVRIFLPHASEVRFEETKWPLQRRGRGLFEWRGPAERMPKRYRVRWRDEHQQEHVSHDPYAFGPQISDFDLHLFSEGNHWHAYRFLGSHARVVDGVQGVQFAVWAPNAERVSVVGDFNRWDGRCHPMRVRGGSGVWELFIPDLGPGTLYKYEIRNRAHGTIHVKADPYGQRAELRPRTASIVPDETPFAWKDGAWLDARRTRDWLHAPMSIYEVHLGSWRRKSDGEFLSYRELAEQLVPYVKQLGFSHIELLPVAEHPYDPSWGYQTTGYFAPTSRFGTPDDFRYFVDTCHQAGLGVLLDWVPAHFPKDAHGLARFDGSALYEHEDPRRGEHLDWSTLIPNFARNEVRGFLLSNAMYWLEEFHLDGLRVDAVASMLYLDYSRTDWVPNQYGGRENLEAIDFLRQLNVAVHQAHPGVLMMAEESTSWPQVSRPVYLGGLGFDLKWNMGWMNDTLRYMHEDPVHRKYHHNLLTFSMLYAFTENFLLPFSHDEVVHGKQSMLNKMPGDEWQRHANLRLLYTYMFTHPGKKLLFMGTEFGHGREWTCQESLDWYVLDYPLHQGVKRLVADLNALYHGAPALHRLEFDWRGFEWIDCHDADQSVVAFMRKADDDFLITIVNFTPVVRHGYRVGVPRAGAYEELLNSDASVYGGSDVRNAGALQSEPIHWMQRDHSIALTLPPLAAVVLRLKG